MVKTSFQSLDQLVKNISDNIIELNNGQLNSSEIENLTENARNLYERLIVIRHKAYEKFGEPTKAIVEEVIETPTTVNESIIEEDSIFDFASEETVKDSIEEEDMMSFDFSETIEEVIPPIIEEPTPVVENIVESKTSENESASLGESLSNNNTSLNDAFKSSSSLGDKLNQSKIDDLKTHIDINKKFSFISDLFNGSNENYNEAINALNVCSSGDEARNVLGELAQKNSWDVEEVTVSIFVDLIERRYL